MGAKTVELGYLYRGPRPAFCDVQSGYKRIKTFLSLQTGLWEYFTDDDYETYKFLFNVKEVKCSNFFPPTKSQVQRCFNIIVNSENRPTYIHCKRGKDRTGYVCAAYRVIFHGWSVDDAVKEWKQLGLNQWFYFWWVWVFKIRYKRPRG